MLGGILGDHIGFAWTAAAFGVIMVVQAAAVTMLSVVRPHTLAAAQSDSSGDKDPLLRRQIGRRLSESHDVVRGCRGGLAAPSVDLTQTSLNSDGSI